MAIVGRGRRGGATKRGESGGCRWGGDVECGKEDAVPITSISEGKENER